MIRHPAIVQLISHQLDKLLAMNPKKLLSTLSKALLASNIILISQGVSAQTAQALSEDELKQINQQPLVKPTKNGRAPEKPSAKATTFEHRDANGTLVKEYQDRGKNREVVVETAAGTRYEMSNPSTANTAAPRDGDVGRVPSVRLPF